jgi:hypothetical protein
MAACVPWRLLIAEIIGLIGLASGLLSSCTFSSSSCPRHLSASTDNLLSDYPSLSMMAICCSFLHPGAQGGVAVYLPAHVIMCACACVRGQALSRMFAHVSEDSDARYACVV